MSGHWIHREVDVHKCARPTRAVEGATGVRRGDQWQCDTCHKVYTVTGIREENPIYPPYIEWDAGFVPSGIGVVPR